MKIQKSFITVLIRPKKQLKTSRHKRKRIENLDDVEKKFDKLKREKKQRKEWGDLEASGESVKAWQPKTPRKKKKAKRNASVKKKKTKRKSSSKKKAVAKRNKLPAKK